MFQKESQSNHSNQSDSGVSDTQPAGHVRSQSMVSSIFSEAWKRGTQLEESSKVMCSGQGRGDVSLVFWGGEGERSALLFLH